MSMFTLAFSCLTTSNLPWFLDLPFQIPMQYCSLQHQTLQMVGWHHQLDRHEFEQAPEVGNGQGSRVCCSPWSRKDSDTTEWLNWQMPHSQYINNWVHDLCAGNTSTYSFSWFQCHIYLRYPNLSSLFICLINPSGIMWFKVLSSLPRLQIIPQEWSFKANLILSLMLEIAPSFVF